VRFFVEALQNRLHDEQSVQLPSSPIGKRLDAVEAAWTEEEHWQVLLIQVQLECWRQASSMDLQEQVEVSQYLYSPQPPDGSVQ